MLRLLRPIRCGSSRRICRQPPDSRVLVVGAGKAAASMALAVERAWPDVTLEGLVITRYAHGAPTQRIRVVEAGHPVPDDAGEAAARDIMQLVSSLQRGDLLLALISGGGSSLLSLPVPEVSMASLKSVTQHVASQRCADRRNEHCAQAPVAESRAVAWPRPRRSAARTCWR